MSCDLIIAEIMLNLAVEMPLGIVPDAGALQRLPRRIPQQYCNGNVFLGRRMSAQEAKAGLVNKVVDKSLLLDLQESGQKKCRKQLL